MADTRFDRFTQIPKPAQQIWHIDPEKHDLSTVSESVIVDDAYVLGHRVLKEMCHQYVTITQTQTEYYVRKNLYAKTGFIVPVHSSFGANQDLEQLCGTIPDYVIDTLNSEYSKDLYGEGEVTLVMPIVYNGTVTPAIERHTDDNKVIEIKLDGNSKQQYRKRLSEILDMYRHNVDAYFTLWHYTTDVVFESLLFWYKYYCVRESQTDSTVMAYVTEYRKTFDKVYFDIANILDKYYREPSTKTVTLKLDFLDEQYRKLLDAMKLVLGNKAIVLIYV